MAFPYTILYNAMRGVLLNAERAQNSISNLERNLDQHLSEVAQLCSQANSTIEMLSRRIEWLQSHSAQAASTIEELFSQIQLLRSQSVLWQSTFDAYLTRMNAQKERLEGMKNPLMLKFTRFINRGIGIVCTSVDDVNTVARLIQFTGIVKKVCVEKNVQNRAEIELAAHQHGLETHVYTMETIADAAEAARQHQEETEEINERQRKRNAENHEMDFGWQGKKT